MKYSFFTMGGWRLGRGERCRWGARAGGLGGGVRRGAVEPGGEDGVGDTTGGCGGWRGWGCRRGGGCGVGGGGGCAEGGGEGEEEEEGRCGVHFRGGEDGGIGSGKGGGCGLIPCRPGLIF